MIEVISCATEVVLKRSNYCGVITGIIIRNEKITYEVSYYESGIYKTNWFNDYEFTISSEQNRVTVGFKETK